MSQAEINPNAPQDQTLTDEQLKAVSGGLAGRSQEEFESGLGNKLSGQSKEEFEAGLGNKSYDQDQESLHDKFGNG
ncbi:MAG: hypothetical protein VKJ64_12090 [Leptolyngbyaceae bacterium]|nr:hypothetical protein [Leptolyngbyaceae bacterium]